MIDRAALIAAGETGMAVLLVRAHVAAATGLALTNLLLLAAAVIGAEPAASPAGLLEGGDPRSEGQGPGLVGSPLLVLAGVVALGIAVAALTALIAARAGRERGA